MTENTEPRNYEKQAIKLKIIRGNKKSQKH